MNNAPAGMPGPHGVPTDTRLQMHLGRSRRGDPWTAHRENGARERGVEEGGGTQGAGGGGCRTREAASGWREDEEGEIESGVCE